MIVRRYATCSPPKFPCVPRISIFAFSPFYLMLINGLLLLLLWERETRRLTNRMNEWYSNRKEDGGYRLIQDLRHRVKGRFVDIEFWLDKNWEIENVWGIDFRQAGEIQKKVTRSPKNSSIAVRLLNSANNYSLKKREKKKERYMKITGKRTNIISSVCT